MLEQFINLSDLEAAAERQLPRHIWDYIAGGAADEVTLARNCTALRELLLRPRFLGEVEQRVLSTTVLEQEISLPVFGSPAAFQRAVHPDGELATHRGAARAGTLAIVPAGDGSRIAELGALALGPLWLQIYHRDRDTTAAWVSLAEQDGYTAVCPTVDVPLQNPKERDRRNWFLPPYDSVRYALHDESFSTAWPTGHAFTWKDLEWLRALTALPVVPKGIMTREDASRAVELGADGILVSNHGGRLIDTTASTIEVLPEIVDAVSGRAEVYLDSGIRRGSDVLKALALGARAVGIGRPLFWGLATGGSDGVARVLEILRSELEVAMAYCSQRSVTALEDGVISIPPGWGAGTPVRRRLAT